MDRLTRALAAIGMLMLAFSYVGAYLSLVKAEPLEFMSGEGPWTRYPHYTVGGQYAEALFWPLQNIDKHLRKSTWQFHDGDEF